MVALIFYGFNRFDRFNGLIVALVDIVELVTIVAIVIIGVARGRGQNWILAQKKKTALCANDRKPGEP